MLGWILGYVLVPEIRDMRIWIRSYLFICRQVVDNTAVDDIDKLKGTN